MNQDLAQYILQQVRDNYNLCAEEFSRTRSYNWKSVKELTGRYVERGMKILDVGCGNGRLLELLRSKGVDYTGIDSSEKLIGEARKKLEIAVPIVRQGNWKLKQNSGNEEYVRKGRKGEESKEGGEGIERRGGLEKMHGKIPPYPPLRRGGGNFVIGDILDLPFEEDEFDIVFCVAVLHHIPSRELRQKAMHEVHSVLKPGGILITANWNFWQDKYRTKMLIRIPPLTPPYKGVDINGQMDFGDIMLPPFNGKGAPRYHHAFTKLGIKRLFKRTGFRVKECYYEKKGEIAGWRDGANLVCVGEKRRNL
ncbi:hypothetical protein A2Y83_01065 [Candidatus Falkowbacteria bacterium RBG_13_39_14]|uniref:Methyltransferase type 11 domain-containing protein n=1 Tax=Candidatus Falkowbacteria bacterium RBG_13_39_14 TaxID=1797985 RepID=A0A1F5S7L8_9BACT|nr:MAG: hypothetical protein A2Y83_01065 [Candidatus Falkowbacteria bacterium RBG_13_39_14]